MNRDFSASKPGEKMVGDITYIDTWEGWVYLATVIDCATRKIAGWAMGDNYKTPLISSAIEMAARNLDLPEGRYSTPTVAATILPLSSGKSSRNSASSDPSGGPGYAMIMLCRNR